MLERILADYSPKESKLTIRGVRPDGTVIFTELRGVPIILGLSLQKEIAYLNKMIPDPPKLKEDDDKR